MSTQGDTAKVRNKKQMLESEGVQFNGSHVASPEFVVGWNALMAV